MISILHFFLKTGHLDKNRKTSELIDIMRQKDFTNIYRIFYQTPKMTHCIQQYLEGSLK